MNMKTKVMLLMAALMLAVTSCSVRVGGGFSMLDPSENITKAKYPQDPFDKVNNHVGGKIQLVQSDQSRVTLSAPDNYIELIEFENEDGELNINFANRNVNIDVKDITILIYTPNLREIKNSGAADIRLDSLTTDEFEVKNSGVARSAVSPPRWPLSGAKLHSSMPCYATSTIPTPHTTTCKAVASTRLMVKARRFMS